jgi:C4-dicarboxylate-specific signal transduction histidine kinase
MNLDAKQAETANAQMQRLAALGFMLAGVCHEVSNPLAAVHSMLQILQSKRGVTPETMEKGLASISANIARVLEITRKLGDFSRVGAEPLRLVRMDEAMEQAITLLRQCACGSGARVVYHGAPEALVLARPGNLQQVLSNILLNAAQAMDGAGVIEARARVADDGGEIILSIRDSGPGIAEECLPHIFEPFFTTKAPGAGIGLGLALSDEIVRELGGTIRASNHPEGGACFELAFPLAPGP